MGFVQLLLIIFVVVVLAALFIYAIRTFSPEPVPPMIINIIWFVAIIIVIFVVLTAFGIVGSDITIPRLR